MKKRIVALVLAATMIFELIPSSVIAAFADTGETTAIERSETEISSQTEDSVVDALPADTTDGLGNDPNKDVSGSVDEELPDEGDKLIEGPATEEPVTDPPRGRKRANRANNETETDTGDGSPDFAALGETSDREPGSTRGEEGEETTGTYAVTFYDRDAEVYATVNVPVGEPIGDALPATIARDDYNAYWAIGEIVVGGQGNEINVTGARIDSNFIPTADTVIVPDYDLITYTVSFFASEDATETVATKTVNANTSYNLNDIPPVPTKEGYSGKWVYAGGNFTNSVRITEDTRVWAEYDQTVFTVQYMVNGALFTKRILTI